MFLQNRKANLRTGLIIIALVIAVAVNLVSLPIYRPTLAELIVATFAHWVILTAGFIRFMGK